MAIKKKYPQAEPKQHGSNNIYIDAALEALQQAKQEDDSLYYLIVVHDTAKGLCGVEFNGDVCRLAATLAHFAKKDELLAKLIELADCTSARDFGKFLDKSEKLIDGYLDELKRNRPKK